MGGYNPFSRHSSYNRPVRMSRERLSKNLWNWRNLYSFTMYFNAISFCYPNDLFFFTSPNQISVSISYFSHTCHAYNASFPFVWRQKFTKYETCPLFIIILQGFVTCDPLTPDLTLHKMFLNLSTIPCHVRYVHLQ